MGVSKTPFTNDEKIAMVNRWIAGESSTVIAKEANISPWSLHIWKKKFDLGASDSDSPLENGGVPQGDVDGQRRSGPRSRYTKDEQLAALRRIDDGESPSKVARELDISDQTIYNWRQKLNARNLAGIGSDSTEHTLQGHYTPTTQITEEQKQEIAHRVKEGESVRELAHEYGVPINNIYLWNARINGATSSETRETRTRESRIVWTDEEKAVLAERIAELRAADIEAPISRIFKEAQESSLDSSRIRTVAIIPPDIINLAQAALDNTIASKNTPIVIEKEIRIEANEDELLAKASTEKLVLFLMPRLVNAFGDLLKFVEDRKPVEKTTIAYPKMVEVKKQEAPNKNLRVLIIGGMSIGQQDELRDRCKDKPVELAFKSATYNPESLPQNFDYAIYCFIPYKEWWEKVKHKYIGERVFSVERDGVNGIMVKILDLVNKDRNPKAHDAIAMAR